MALLPAYSVNHSLWWEAAAEDVFRTSIDFRLITRTIKFIPLRDPTTPITLLSKRQNPWLKQLLHIVCQDAGVKEPHCESRLSTAETIVILSGQTPSSDAPTSTLGWVLLTLTFDSNFLVVADKLDQQINSEFCKISIRDWVAWCCGYSNDNVSSFLNTSFNIRNDLVKLVRVDTFAFRRLQELQAASLYSLYWSVCH
jgi:hypothetical protein